MAEQERLTKAERREQKRQRRLEEEQARAEQAKRERRRNVLYGVSLATVVAVLVFLAFGNQPDLTDAITLTRADAEAAEAASGCEVVDLPPIESREHLDPATAPPAEVLYTNGRPTATGPHFVTPLPVRNGVPENPIDERGSTHNLEHGTILVWIDEEQVPAEDVDDIGDWVATLNQAGFAENTGRAGIMASPIGDEVPIDSGKALAIRAWGVAMDCDSWDRDWANGFTIENFGTRGTAPERFIGTYPEEVLAYEGDGDTQLEDDETPQDDTPPASEIPSIEPSDEDAVDDGGGDDSTGESEE